MKKIFKISVPFVVVILAGIFLMVRIQPFGKACENYAVFPVFPERPESCPLLRCREIPSLNIPPRHWGESGIHSEAFITQPTCLSWKPKIQKCPTEQEVAEVGFGGRKVTVYRFDAEVDENQKDRFFYTEKEVDEQWVNAHCPNMTRYNYFAR